MKKFLAIIPIAILFVLLSDNIKVSAETIDNIMNYNTVLFYSFYNPITQHSGGTTMPVGYYNYYFVTNNASGLNITSNGQITGYFNYYVVWGSDAPYSGVTFTGEKYVQAYNPFISGIENIIFIKMKGVVSNNSEKAYYDSYDDYINPNPSWFEIWSNSIYQFLNDWIPWAVDLDNWLDDIYLDLFGMKLDGDDVQYGNDVEFYDLPSPTPFPTPIPYQQQLAPDGSGGFIIKYIYPDPSGNPITATAPPPQPTYVIKITDTPQFDISGVPIPPAEGLQEAIDAIDDNIDDYQDGFDAIQGSFSTLPVKWFFFFGIPAAIILIAGIIRSLLGG